MFKHGKLKKFIALIILDGWGIAPESENNLISLADTPNFDRLVETYLVTVLTNPLKDEELEAPSEDACRLSHYLIGTSRIEHSLKSLEKRDPLAINSLSRILSKHNLKQLYLTDSEKFPQLSYFFRGCYSQLLKGEEQILVKKNGGIYQELKKQLETRKFNFIVINLSGADVLAHSGDAQAVTRGIAAVDKYLGQIVEKILLWGGKVLVVADHGKAEEFHKLRVKSEELKVNDDVLDSVKAHTSNKVPFIFIGEKSEGQSFPGVKLVGSDLSHLKPSGFLTDVAPTVLKILSIKKPEGMMGRSLV